MKKLLKFLLVLVLIVIILIPTMLYLRQKDGLETSKEEIVSDFEELEADAKNSIVTWWESSELKAVFDDISLKLMDILPESWKD